MVEHSTDNRKVTGSSPVLGTITRVAELVDAPDLGSGVERRVGSSPTLGTILKGYLKINDLAIRLQVVKSMDNNQLLSSMKEMIKVIQSQQSQIDLLKTRVHHLEGELKIYV